MHYCALYKSYHSPYGAKEKVARTNCRAGDFWVLCQAVHVTMHAGYKADTEDLGRSVGSSVCWLILANLHHHTSLQSDTSKT